MQRKNSEPYIATYLHSKGKRLGLPISGSFELTARCNFNCPMCYVHMTQEQVDNTGKELSAQQWLDIAKDARDKGMVFALLTGGEPLMRKDFFEIYDGMRELGLLVTINSNGYMLNGDILERFLKNPPFRFNISLYGGCNETYQKMCGRPAYDRVKENIRALRSAGVEVNVNLSITPYNYNDIAKISDDAAELDVSIRASSYMYPPIRVNGEQFGSGNRLSAEEAAACMVQWDLLRFPNDEFALRAKRMKDLAAVEQDGCSVEVGEGVRCRAGSTSFWMTWDGKMLPCGMMSGPVAYPLEVGFDAAWEQIKHETAAICTSKKCVNCAKKEVCTVCAAICFTETGRFDGVPEYMCRMTDERVRQTWNAYLERKEERHED